MSSNAEIERNEHDAEASNGESFMKKTPKPRTLPRKRVMGGVSLMVAGALLVGGGWAALGEPLEAQPEGTPEDAAPAATAVDETSNGASTDSASAEGALPQDSLASLALLPPLESSTLLRLGATHEALQASTGVNLQRLPEILQQNPPGSTAEASAEAQAKDAATKGAQAPQQAPKARQGSPKPPAKPSPNARVAAQGGALAAKKPSSQELPPVTDAREVQRKDLEAKKRAEELKQAQERKVQEALAEQKKRQAAQKAQAQRAVLERRQAAAAYATASVKLKELRGLDTPGPLRNAALACELDSGDKLMTPWVGKVRSYIAAGFGVTNIGGSRPGDPQDHGKGLALDVMVPLSSQQGDKILIWAMQNAEALNLKYAIWKQVYYPVGGKARAMEDRGSLTQNHYDHVHLSFKKGSGVCPS